MQQHHFVNGFLAAAIVLTIPLMAIGRCIPNSASIEAGIDTITYEKWRINNNLPDHSEYEDPDSDGYVNFEEYAYGLIPNIPDSSGADQLITFSTGDPTYPLTASFKLRDPYDQYEHSVQSTDSTVYRHPVL